MPTRTHYSSTSPCLSTPLPCPSAPVSPLLVTMGVLTVATPLKWEDSLAHLPYVREHGVLQFIENYRCGTALPYLNLARGVHCALCISLWVARGDDVGAWHNAYHLVHVHVSTLFRHHVCAIVVSPTHAACGRQHPLYHSWPLALLYHTASAKTFLGTACCTETR